MIMIKEFSESALGGREDSFDEEDVDENQNEPPDSVRDEDTSPEMEEHLISKVRLKEPLTANQTLTGLHGDSLTIKAGVLLEGRTYAVSLKVKHQGKLLFISTLMKKKMKLAFLQSQL